MKTLIYIIVITVLFLSCTKGYKDLNIDPTQFTKASPEAVMQTAFKTTGNLMATVNCGPPAGKYWEVANWITPGARYNMGDAGEWQQGYVNIGQNLTQIINDYGTDSAFTNRVQIARIWKCYIQSVLVGTFGPIPVTQANDLQYLANNLYDAEDSVYMKLLSTLKEASAKINLAKTTDKLTYDVIYGGDLLKWKKFANTLRLKIALRCTKNLGTIANTTISEVMADEANTINSEADIARVPYENLSNNENPYYILYTKNPFTLQIPKLNDFMLAFLRSYKDPRLEYYFDSVKLVANRYIMTDTLTSLADDSFRIVTYPIPYYGLPKSAGLLSNWPGALAGQVNPQGGVNINAYSNLSPTILTNPARPYILLGYAETLLMKAEAKQLGLGGTNTAEAYYNAGIDANFAFWGIPTARRDAYKAVNGIKWGTTGIGFRDYLGITNANIPDGDINKIYIQHWLNYYPDQGFDFWCLQRRSFVINPPPHTNPAYASFTFTEIPYRGTYPSNLQNVNPVGYADALGKLNIPVGAETTNGYYPLKFMVPHTVKDWNAVTPQYDNGYIQKWYGVTIESLKAAAVSSGFNYTITRTYKP